ncbi:NAD(P)H-dependent oxidoreductase [Paenibacillus sp. CGMCC 1.16610]|uniref:NAD(P)H-dependent oxidoreductase n=1 Tax=Paenibacillus anseongense TaxID=2682845 RepID=A0ABW9U010_9BACL|nr:MULTISPECIES: NADPH-dependent FMN reductase [Paenibacillus]MBA2937110.1 NAD(P)H-dependent oxidoreductase [Paenibacillus sp. CGMCC 1.16610]MVQ33432.1 NAD(P)H-dependent oxidoreductase [Paenibacillus anseongense]
MSIRIGIIVGSLRENSFNQMIANSIPELVDSVEYENISIANLPLYNADLDHGEGPVPVKHYREAIQKTDGILIVSPEYNSGIPGVLKNALDWASTPTKTAVLIHKPSGVIGATPGAKGTILSQQQIRQTLDAIQSYVMPAQKMYISQITDKIDSNTRKLTDDTTRKYLQRYVQSFVQWINQVQRLNE